MSMEDLGDKLASETGEVLEQARDSGVDHLVKTLLDYFKIPRRQLPAGQAAGQAPAGQQQPGWLKKKAPAIVIGVILLTLSGWSFLRYMAEGNDPSSAVEVILENKKVRLPYQRSNQGNIEQEPELNFEEAMYQAEKGRLRNYRGWVIVKPPAACMYKLCLDSGARIYIDANSKIRFFHPFGSKGREIYLEKGQAGLNVQTYLGRDITIYSRHLKINADTAFFNMNTYDQAVETISVLTGLVLLSVKADTTAEAALLSGAQEVRWRPQPGPPRIEKFDAEDLTGWYLRGRRLFNEVPLKTLCHAAEQWYDIHFVVDTLAANIPVTWFLDRKQSSGVFLENLEKEALIVSERLNNGSYYLRAKP